MAPSRRQFLEASAAAAAGLAIPRLTSAMPMVAVRDRAPEARGAGRPVVVASANGNRSRNADGKTGVQLAHEMMLRGSDPLDAAMAGVNIVELDPTDQSVGVGGLPNEAGVVQLDASCMHGPTKRAGAVACLEDIATPSLVAKAVMDHTDHIMLVGHHAKDFALRMGFTTQNLLTEESRQMWHRWRSRLNPNDNWLDIPRDARSPDGGEGGEVDQTQVWYDADGIARTYGTINMCAVDARGDIGSVTTTSGLSWKVPGRTGDSPIIGAGQYCDNGVGAAGSTGRGEANIKVCGAFLAVEFMRQGKSPEQALIEVMQRVIAMTEARLLDDRGRPYFDLQFYAVAKDGRYAGASAFEGSRFAVADERGARTESTAFLFKASERPRRA
ncbi:MAG: N(4)-(beta-N-acetylglucosaminyl)-L-asparaginase [Gemmatimonadaceae bacterium]